MSFWESLSALLGDGRAVAVFVSSLLVVLLVTPLVARLAPRIGGLDDPSDRPRVHRDPVPRIGGLAIVAGILVAVLAFGRPEGPYVGIMIGTVAVALVGLVDDLRRLPPSVKIAGVAAAALIPVLGFDLVSFHRISLPLIGNHNIGDVALPLTLLWIVLLTNLVNLIDGMDSLAAGIVAIAALAFALLAASWERMDAAVLALAVAGATLAFLHHNYHPAKIFMGDSGSLALGFMLATVALEGVMKTAATIALAAPLLVVAVPILDTSFVVLKRLKYRRPPWRADHNHFYHRFLRIGFSQRRTAAYLHVWAVLLAAFAILLRFVPPRPLGQFDLSNTLIVAAAGLFVVATSVWMVYTLEILKERHLRALRVRRAVEEPEREEAVERALTAGLHADMAGEPDARTAERAASR